jgi:predicted methyltransferase
MRVLDLLAGDGYYSELLSHVVGPEGYVYLHNNQGYIGLQPRAVQRVHDNRLNNVELYVRELQDIMLPTASLDMVLLNLVYHDFYYRNNGWEVSVDQLFTVVHRVLKPGGVLAVIDHEAPPGSGSSYAQALHRIERSFAVADISARGFELVGSSETLHNPEDNLRASVFSPDIRRHTSRFVLKFISIN